jgi:malate dehydrogenase (oxaloacetate-decarboxylating)(NADP+)
MADRLREDALEYHRKPIPGKLAITPTKPLATQRDLSLAYSPGVAEACLEIVRDPLEVAHLTARSNLVAVVTNGTAVLGLGSIGALASKPVMEGKVVLFKKFAGIDAFDIEIDEREPKRLIEIVAALEPSFGAAPTFWATQKGLEQTALHPRPRQPNHKLPFRRRLCIASREMF